MGAIDGAPEYREALALYGHNLGMAFQIADDLLDYTGTEAVTGKPFVLPDGTASRDFLLTAVEASVGPLSVDLVAVAFELGPVTLTLNFLTLVGILIVAMIVRAWI
jgi:hypothetical protein